MITISSALQTHLAQPYQTTTTCWLVVLTNGTVKGFTSFDRPITFDLEAAMTALSLPVPPGILATGSVTYAAATGYSPTDVVGGSSLAPDNLEVNGILTSPSITEADLYAGIWDSAAVTIFLVNWKDLTQGAMILRSGLLGQVTVERNTFKAELRGLTQAYSRTVGKLTSAMCRATFGDTQCNVKKTATTWLALTGYQAAIPGDATSGSIVKSTAYNGKFFTCIQTGSSGAAEPTWDTTVGNTTNDGSVVWKCHFAVTVTGTLTGVAADNQTLYDTSRTEPGPAAPTNITAITVANPGVVTTATALGLPAGTIISISGCLGMTAVNTDTTLLNPSGLTFDLPISTVGFPVYTGGGKVVALGAGTSHFDFGIISWTSGANNGLRMEVKNYVPGQITLQLPMPYTCAIGDTYTLTAGCGKSLIDDCKTRYDNVLNFRGEPYLPGLDRLVQVGNQQQAV